MGARHRHRSARQFLDSTQKMFVRALLVAFFLTTPSWSKPAKPSRKTLDKIRSSFDEVDGDVAARRLATPGVQGLLTLAKQARRQRNEAPLITLTDQVVKKYITNSTRDFASVIFASADEQFCAYCKRMETLIETATRDYLAPDGYVMDKDQIPTFFFTFDAHRDKRMPAFLNLDAVPVIVHFTPSNMECVDGEEKVVPLDKPRERKRLAACVSTDPNPATSIMKQRVYETPEQIAVALAELLGRNDLAPSFRSEQSKQNRLMLIGGGVVAVAGLGLYFFEFFRAALIKRPTVIALLALAAYWLSSSGLIYNLQHGMQFYGNDWRTGGRTYVAPHMRSQFVFEGLAFSFLAILASFAFYTAINLKRCFGIWVHPVNQTDPITWRQVTLSAVTVAFLIVSYLAYTAILETCAVKLPKLGMTFFPDPEEFTYGSPRVDRGYSF